MHAVQITYKFLVHCVIIMEFIYLMVFLFVLVEKSTGKDIVSIILCINIGILFDGVSICSGIEKAKKKMWYVCINIGIHLFDGVSICSCRKSKKKKI